MSVTNTSDGLSVVSTGPFHVRFISVWYEDISVSLTILTTVFVTSQLHSKLCLLGLTLGPLISEHFHTHTLPNLFKHTQCPFQYIQLLSCCRFFYCWPLSLLSPPASWTMLSLRWARFTRWSVLSPGSTTPWSSSPSHYSSVSSSRTRWVTSVGSRTLFSSPQHSPLVHRIHWSEWVAGGIGVDSGCGSVGMK